ncbi:serine/threonine-protein kinase [bacterium]|nr:serine/threonine-protein kinase [bacterium]
MKPERWKQIDQLFSEALSLDIEKRQAFLDAVCAGDENLRKEIESLLQCEQQSSDLNLASPARIAADLFASQRLEIAVGKSIGPYKILSLIGIGGMGEVYRASDPRIGREVALKILPSQFSEDRDRMRRFEQEARTAGLLNHPNIVAIFDAGSENGCPYLVSELLQGQSLRDKLNENPLAFRKAIEYALQIAKGLSAAHEKGIVHRDLKPENIFITREGVVKILDFGLAKLTHPEQSGTSISETETGIVMGTVVYMSPEQVRGAKVDHRSDIFAFGAILFEMLSGKRPFQGESQIEVMHGIIKEDPPELTSMSVSIPPSLDRVVRRCLEKNPDQRFQSSSDLAFALDTLSSPTISGPGGTLPIRKWNLPWILAAFSLVAAFTVGMILYQAFQKDAAIPPAPVQRFSIALPEKTVIDTIAMSPDGKYVAYAPIDRSGNSSLLLRSLDSIESQEIPGTESASRPFWSPDSTSIGFFTTDKLKIVSIGGGPPKTLCDVESPTGGTWNQDGVILFALANFFGLYRISATGGEAVPVTSLDASHSEWSHRFPQFLPDGRHFFYMLGSHQEDYGGLYVGSLDGKVKKRLHSNLWEVEYADPGYGLFLMRDKLMAQPFNTEKLEFEGEPAQIAENVGPFLGQAALFSVSQKNILAYISQGAAFPSRPSWFDRSGKPVDKFENRLSAYGDPDLYFFWDLSADEKQLLTGFGTGSWMIDLLTGQITRFAITNEGKTVFSADGNHVFYIDSGEDGHYIMKRLSNGSGKAQLLYRTQQWIAEPSLSPDGRYLLFDVWNSETKRDQWILPLFGDRKPFPYLETGANEYHAQFSPDGKWIAYCSDESGIPQVYVRSFPIDAGGKWQLSFESGQQPRWRKDGKELFYLTVDKKLMAVEVESRDSFQVGASKLLFQTEAHPNLNVALWNSRQYFPADNGKRFLINSTVDSPSERQITILLNWKSLLKKQ